MGGLRIALIGAHYSPEVSGNAPYTAGMAEGLRSLGHKVGVVTGMPHYPEMRLRPGYARWKISETINDVKVLRLRHFVARRPTNWTRAVMEVSFGLRVSFTRAPKADVIVLVSPAFLANIIYMLRLLAFRSRIPVVLWVQDIYSSGLSETSGSKSRLIRIAMGLEAWLARKCSRLIVIHDGFAKVFEELGVEDQKIEVIPNWSHVAEGLLPQIRVQEIRRSLGWPEGFIALHAGNMGLKQGLETLVEAGRQLSLAADRSMHIVLMGDGNQKRRLVSLARGVHAITFMEPQSNADFVDILQAADVLLVCEKVGVSEMSVPSKITSYYTSGRPIVASVGEGLSRRELMDSGAGICVEPGSPSEVIRACERLSRDAELRNSLGQAGLLRSRQRLGAHSAFANFEAVLRSVVQGAE